MAEAIIDRENAPTYSVFQKRMTKIGCTFDEDGCQNQDLWVAIIDNKCGDPAQFEGLVEQVFANTEKFPNTNTSTGTKVTADGAYDTHSIHRYCREHGIDPLIPVRINFTGKADGCMPHKEAGFRQLGGFDHIDKKAEHVLADLSREQKREFQKA